MDYTFSRRAPVLGCLAAVLAASACDLGGGEDASPERAAEEAPGPDAPDSAPRGEVLDARALEARVKAVEAAANKVPEPVSDDGPRGLLGAQGVLPRGEGGRPLPKDGLLITLRPRRIEFGGETMVRLNTTGLGIDGVEDDVIVPLRDAISSAPKGRPLVIADAGARFEWLALIVNTLHAAGRPRHGVVVEGSDGDLAVFDTAGTSATKATSGTTPPLDLRVTVQADGYRVSHGAGSRQPAAAAGAARPTIPLAKIGAVLTDLSRWDVAQLDRRIGEYDQLFPTETTVTLAGDRDVPVGAVAQAMEILRGSTCTPAAAESCRFATVAVAAIPADTVVDRARAEADKPSAAPTTGLGGSARPPKLRGKVRQAKALVTGGLDADDVRRTVRLHRAELAACYDAGLERDPNLEGRVTVTFTVGGAGSVTEATVTKAVKDTKVARCFADAIEGWRFPRPRAGEAVVTYPFQLSAR